MNARPILFTGEMVRAILDGNKTQTRREIKPQPLPVETGSAFLPVETIQKRPFGKTGDRLWVRETFQPVQLASEVTQWRYCATDPKGLANWKPSIFMPRAASRITLEIVAVRVERLQEISEDDAFAEGCSTDFFHTDDCDNDDCALCGGVDDCAGVAVSAKNNYQTLWEKINGPGSWAKNPWVWVIEFKKV